MKKSATPRKATTTRKPRAARKAAPPELRSQNLRAFALRAPDLRKARIRILSAARSAYRRLLAVIHPFHVPTRRLRSLESLSLPNKQTISLVQVDGQEFLIGGTASSVVMLAKLERAPSAIVAPEAAQLLASFATKVQ
jgi:hypothetical protein